MKKVILVFLAILLAVILTACAKKGVCENCGQTETLKEFTDSSGSTYWYCEDCTRMAKLLN